VTVKKASNRKELISPEHPCLKARTGGLVKALFLCEVTTARILPPSADETVDMWPPLPDLDPRRRVGGRPLAGILTSFETLAVTMIEIPNVRFWPDSRGPA